jgi:metallo-beta-lactamase family protein
MVDCEVLLCESTYGGRTHEPGQDAARRLEEIIGRTIARGGKVIIPAFSVDRTQEVVHTLDQLWNQGRLPVVPVFVDSPLATNATEVYRAHPECYDADLHAYMMHDANPFGFERLTYVRKVEQSKALNTRTDPMIIISASGMCEAGRILHHLRNNVHDARTTILMVGFCAEHTLGARLLERPPQVRIFGQEHALKAEVVQLDAFSAHADEGEMIDFLGHLDRDRLQQIYLVHGNYERQQAFQQALQQRGYPSVSIPERGTTVDL